MNPRGSVAMENTKNYVIRGYEFKGFSSREKKIELALLVQMLENSGLPEGFKNDKLRLAMNENYGGIFLTNRRNQVAMVIIGCNELELLDEPPLYVTPSNGVEGFLSDLVRFYPDLDSLDQGWVKSLARISGLEI